MDAFRHCLFRPVSSFARFVFRLFTRDFDVTFICVLHVFVWAISDRKKNLIPENAALFIDKN